MIYRGIHVSYAPQVRPGPFQRLIGAGGALKKLTIIIAQPAALPKSAMDGRMVCS